MTHVRTSGYTTVRGARLAYEVTGQGVTLIWGHGLSMTRASDAELGLVDWDRVGATVVRYDARGHGESESTAALDGYSWAELARDQLALADGLGIGRFVAAGASMGCGTALHSAVLAPERVRAIVLVIPPTAWETRAAQAAQWEIGAGVIESEGVEAMIAARAELELPDPYKDDPSQRDRQAAATRAWEPSRLALVMRGAATADLPSREQVTTIAAPALILAWTGDPVHPRATAEELAALLPDARLHVASTTAEMAGWTGLIDDFVGGLPG
jgi:3-oxoadipate enol-lactonase